MPPAAGKAADSTTPFKNILVAVDFGEGSSEAVERALSMANGRQSCDRGARGSRCAARVLPLDTCLTDGAEYQRHLVRDAWRRIPEIIPADARTSRKVHARVVTGDPAAEISRVAAEIDADLILMGVTARGAIGRLVMGSTAARVIRTAGRPVLAIPQPVGERAAHGSAPDRLVAAA